MRKMPAARMSATSAIRSASVILQGSIGFDMRGPF